MEFVYGKKEIEQTLKVGDIVFMNDKYKVPEGYQGQLFTVRSKVQDICGTPCVFLKNYTGAYAVDGLTKATERQKAIYILLHLDDARYEKMLAGIAEAETNIEKHNDILDNEEARNGMRGDELLKWYDDWDKKHKSLEQMKAIKVEFFFELLNGKHPYLYGEPVKGADE
ncbi:MAG: hypothetical protein IJ514_08050 [Clostridia bacterium]|nr:hypothetical protein [Clostridia bacterium]